MRSESGWVASTYPGNLRGRAQATPEPREGIQLPDPLAPGPARRKRAQEERDSGTFPRAAKSAEVCREETGAGVIFGEGIGPRPRPEARTFLLSPQQPRSNRNYFSRVAVVGRRCSNGTVTPAAGSSRLGRRLLTWAGLVGQEWVRVAMAVDITLLFRASVKTVKTRNKALGVAVGGGVEGSRDELFRRSPRPKGDFSSRAAVVSWFAMETAGWIAGGADPNPGCLCLVEQCVKEPGEGGMKSGAGELVPES